MYKGAEICPSIAYNTLCSHILLGQWRKLGSFNKTPLRGSSVSGSVLSKRRPLTWRERVQRGVSRLKKPGYVRALSESRLRLDGLASCGSVSSKEKKHSAVVVFRRMLLVSIAHAMDPVQRAGQTAEANERGAMRYGRVARNSRRRGRKGFKSILSMLIKLFLAFIIPTMIESSFITDCIIKSLKAKFGPSSERRKRKARKNRFGSRCNGVLCFGR